MVTMKQKEILANINGKGTIKAEVIAKAGVVDLPEGPRTYMGLPGTTIIGIGKFPRTVDDPETQKKIEGSRSFKQGHIWVDTATDEEKELMDKAMDGLSFSQLRKLASALGHRDISRLTKLQLIEVCTRDGASLL